MTEEYISNLICVYIAQTIYLTICNAICELVLGGSVLIEVCVSDCVLRVVFLVFVWVVFGVMLTDASLISVLALL